VTRKGETLGIFCQSLCSTFTVEKKQPHKIGLSTPWPKRRKFAQCGHPASQFATSGSSQVLTFVQLKTSNRKFHDLSQSSYDFWLYKSASVF
jgi:predicted DNA-binding protein (MmcQ/YjbR family)